MGLDITGLIGMLLGHQTEAEKSQLYGQESQQDWANKLKYQPSIDAADLYSTANATKDLGTQNGPSVGLSPSFGAAMYNRDGTINPEAISSLLQTQSNQGAGLYGSNTSTDLMRNNALTAQAAKAAQDTSAGISPTIAQNLNKTAENQAATGALTSGFPLAGSNPTLEGEAYTAGQKSQLAGANRNVFDSSMIMNPGSPYGWRMNPITGVADITPNLTAGKDALGATMLNDAMGRRIQPTGLPVYDSDKNLVGYTPHGFDPDYLPANPVTSSDKVSTSTPQKGADTTQATPTISLGASVGGQAFTPTVKSPALNPLALLHSGGLPTPSGNGKFYVDKNNQLQYSSGLNMEGATNGRGIWNNSPSKEDIAWVKRILGSNIAQ